MKYIVAGAGAFIGGQSTILAGLLNQETASIAYTGELLPAGTALYGSELGITSEVPLSATYVGGVLTPTSSVNGRLEIRPAMTSIVAGDAIEFEVNMVAANVGTKIKLATNAGGWAEIAVTNAVVGSNKIIGIVPSGSTVVYALVYPDTTNGTAPCTVGTYTVKEVLINPNLRYLKNSGKDKTPALVESGQGKFFNGTNQYINTGIIPNASQGTLVTRFTYVSGMVSRCIIGTSEISIWVNASGKIEGLFGNVVITSTDVLVSGRSYHVELPYLGNNASIKVDNVNKAGGTASSFTPTLPIYIGARNNNGTADRFFNNVIDETYYYDVALTDAQINMLYQYPEKVKDYNGAIVPDIGNEANCKLFLPMCENIGSNVVNVAVARGTTKNPNTSYYCNNTGGVITLGSYNSTDTFSFSQAGSATGNTYTPQCFYTNTNGLPTDTYIIKVTATVISGTCYFGDGGGGVVTPGARGVGTYEFYGIGTKNGGNRIGVNIDGMNYTTYSATFKIEYYAITAYPLVNYTTAMHTSAAKLSYGAQCTAWKRDSLGVLLGMSNGLSFDGWVSVKYPVVASANVIPDTTPIVMEAIVYCEATGDYKFVMGSNLLRLGIDADGEPWCRIGSFQGRITPSPNTTTKSYYHHIAVQSNGTTLNAWVDGVQYRTNVAITVGGADGVNFVLGSSGWDKPYKRIAGTPKIHKGAEYAKFNIAKAWAKAQKTIAKLGA